MCAALSPASFAGSQAASAGRLAPSSLLLINPCWPPPAPPLLVLLAVLEVQQHVGGGWGCLRQVKPNGTLHIAALGSRKVLRLQLQRHRLGEGPRGAAAKTQLDGY